MNFDCMEFTMLTNHEIFEWNSPAHRVYFDNLTEFYSCVVTKAVCILRSQW